MKHLTKQLNGCMEVLGTTIDERTEFARQQSATWQMSHEGIVYRAKTEELRSAKCHLLDACADLRDYNS